MASLNRIMDHIADHVIVEQGTSGDWEYRKYADGVAEAWANIPISPTSYSFNTSQQSGKFYTNANWTSRVFNLPTGLFLEAPTVVATIGNNGYLIYGVVGIADAGTTFTMRAISLYSTTFNISKVYAFAIGRWK